MNLAEMVERVQSDIGDNSEAHITKADITAWLNEGQLQVARLTSFPEGFQTYPTDTDKIEYDLPEDIVFLRQVQFEHGIFPEKIEFERLSQLGATDPTSGSTNTDPKFYYILNRKLRFYPQAYTGRNFNIIYSRRPAILVEETDIPELPTSVHNDIIIYAKQRAMEMQEELQNAQYYSGQFAVAGGQSHYEIRYEADPHYPIIQSIDDFD